MLVSHCHNVLTNHDDNGSTTVVFARFTVVTFAKTTVGNIANPEPDMHKDSDDIAEFLSASWQHFVLQQYCVEHEGGAEQDESTLRGTTLTNTTSSTLK